MISRSSPVTFEYIVERTIFVGALNGSRTANTAADVHFVGDETAPISMMADGARAAPGYSDITSCCRHHRNPSLFRQKGRQFHGFR